VLHDQHPAARVDVKGARVDLLRLDVLDRCRLAGRLIDRIHDGAVFSALEYLLALKFDRRLSTVRAVQKAAVRMDVYRTGRLARLDIVWLGQSVCAVLNLRFDPAV